MYKEPLKHINKSRMGDFILAGLTQRHDFQIFLFVIFLFIYLVTMLGNACIIFLVYTHSKLRIPMYYFISSLSFLDICYSSDIAPKMLVDLLSLQKTISYVGCATQLFFFAGLGSTECFLFAVMAYDRYVAICNPLNYNLLMQKKTCVGLVSGSYSGGFLHSLIETCFTFCLSFCESHVLIHFACDFPPLLSISCTDTTVNEIVLSTLTSFVTISSVLVIFVSYISIGISIIKIRSTEGRKKAFSTCASHIVGVTLFYATVFYVYLRFESKSSVEKSSVTAVFYGIVIPMLNPLIYSFRNKDIKMCLQQTFRKKK